MNIKIVVAAHKPYNMPDDPMYVPLHVGHAGKPDIGFEGDDTGDNISMRNATLCELTGVYWAWKNLDADYVGLVHYRRYFTKKAWIARTNKNKFNSILTEEQAKSILERYSIVLPRPRKYYIETLRSHFVHVPYSHEKDIEAFRQIIAEKEPDYLDIFDKVMSRTWAHMFNMFIMKREYLNQYCEWLFPILLEADRRIDVSKYTPMEARAVAYLAEFMIDVWNEKQKIPYQELPVMFMEKQNWIMKAGRFLTRKFFCGTND